MAYDYDIFISYLRHDETREWIQQHLSPLLTLRVAQELGRTPKIFIDQDIEVGTAWPLRLALALAGSRILIPLWSKGYFRSKWCVEELSTMRAREQETSRNTPKHPRGLVIPGIVHDGDDFPCAIKDIQSFSLQKCFNVRMSRNSQRAEELDDIINQHAGSIARAIEEAPEWRSEWRCATSKVFFSLYYDPTTPSQLTLPRL